MTDKPELPAENKAGRPTKAQLDTRAAELDTREENLKRLEMELEQRSMAPSPPVTAVRDQREHKVEEPRVAKPIDVGKKFPDVEPYLEKYGADMRLMWINDMNGDVQRWINAGAEPVPVLLQTERKFAGLTDSHESQWTRVVGGDDGMGNFFWVYLLMMPHQRYDEVKLAPLRKRQDDIRKAIKRGADQSQGAGGELGSYAPNLPTGGRGFEQVEDPRVDPHQKIADHVTGRN